MAQEQPKRTTDAAGAASTETPGAGAIALPPATAAPRGPAPPPLPRSVTPAPKKEQAAAPAPSPIAPPAPRAEPAAPRPSAAKTPAPAASPAPATELPAAEPPAADAAPATASERRAARRRAAAPSRERIAANDDAPSIGGLIFALQQKPSNTPFVYAAGASGVWAAIALVGSWFILRPELATGTFVELLGKPILLSVFATILGPVLLFWFLALLAWRTDELKLRSSAMTEVAVRLAEPDRMAEQQIASLGQAVRRQVSFMNDAVGRAIGRAGELEALVHSEVSALERSYEENERRIRGLIAELAGERTSLLNTSERVTESLRTLGSEVPMLIDRLSAQQIKLTGIIEGAGQNLHALESAIATQTGNLEGALGTRTEQLQGLLENYTSALGTALGSRSQEMQSMFEGYMQSIDGTIGGRTGELQTVLEEYARALDATLANRAQALDVQLVARTRALDDAFTDRLRVFDESVLRSTMVIDSTVTERSQALTAAMETHARSIADTIGKQAGELDETLMNGISAVRRSSENITRQSIKAIEGLANQSELLRNVSENLLTQINGVTGRFEAQGQTILRAANALETANSRIDTTLQQRHADLSGTLDRLSGKVEDIGRVVTSASSTLEGSFTEAEQRTRLLTSELTRSAEARSQSMLAEVERLKSAAAQQTERSLEDLRSRFTDVSRELTEQLGSMSNQFSETSSDMRNRALRAAQDLEHEQARLKAQYDKLPVASQESSEAMRRALQDQLKALEQLSSLTTREARQRDVTPPAPMHAPPAALPAPPLPARKPPPVGSGPAPGQGGRNLSSLSSSLVQELQQRQRPPAPTGAGPGEGRDGWKLGDLLARASQDEQDEPGQGRPPLAAAGGAPFNLEVMARALDPATASAIWARLRAGQRGIMVRSIYTAEGRAVFDEVSRRYRTETEFQGTVGRFLMDFEQIVREADQRDPTGRLAHGQFVSDTGRVYLFLAHASGRLA